MIKHHKYYDLANIRDTLIDSTKRSFGIFVEANERIFLPEKNKKEL